MKRVPLQDNSESARATLISALRLLPSQRTIQHLGEAGHLLDLFHRQAGAGNCRRAASRRDNVIPKINQALIEEREMRGHPRFKVGSALLKGHSLPCRRQMVCHAACTKCSPPTLHPHPPTWTKGSRPVLSETDTRTWPLEAEAEAMVDAARRAVVRNSTGVARPERRPAAKDLRPVHAWTKTLHRQFRHAVIVNIKVAAQTPHLALGLAPVGVGSSCSPEQEPCAAMHTLADVAREEQAAASIVQIWSWRVQCRVYCCPRASEQTFLAQGALSGHACISCCVCWVPLSETLSWKADGSRILDS